MKPVTLDVVLVLPASLCRQAIVCSEFLSGRVAETGGSSSHFQLGKPFPGAGAEHCEPHVSLFMLTVDEAEINGVTQVVEHDEVADEPDGGHDRFSPHVTLTWPRDPDFRVALQGLPSARVFSGLLTELVGAWAGLARPASA